MIEQGRPTARPGLEAGGQTADTPFTTGGHHYRRAPLSDGRAPCKGVAIMIEITEGRCLPPSSFNSRMDITSLDFSLTKTERYSTLNPDATTS